MTAKGKNGARVGHRKSRKGCLTCRARRVKCDETHPHCKTCTRLDLDCHYAPTAVSSPDASSRSALSTDSPALAESASRRGVTPNGGFYSNGQRDKDDGLAEDRARRMMELRLLHFWMSKGRKLMSGDWITTWNIEVPALALQNDHLLHALLATAAMQLSPLHPDDADLAIARDTYWTLALHGQAVALQHPDTMDRQAMSFAAYLIEANAFSALGQRVLEPYTPPIEWIEVSRGAMEITPDFDEMAQDAPLRSVIETCAPIFDDPNLKKGVGVGIEYQRILDPYISEIPDISTIEDAQAYESVLRYVSAFRKAVISGEPGYMHTRRVILFTLFVPPLFITFLKQHRPRALAVMACFFAVVAQSNALPYFGDTDKNIPKREVSAIHNTLPDEWQLIIAKPLAETFSSVSIRLDDLQANGQC